jgi:hypothetical protein
MKFVSRVIIWLCSVLCSVISAHAQLEPRATLSLNPAAGAFMVGDLFDVDILLDTGNYAIDGVDIHFLNYDPNVLEVQDAHDSSPGVQILSGSLMPFTLTNSVDVTAGTIDFSQITAGGTTFTGSGVLATVTFKVIGVGSADLVFDFTPGNTRDTNVACCGGFDALASATGAHFTLTDERISVVIDIEPGSDTNPIAPVRRGMVPVAVLTTSTFDATIVDLTTVLFGRTGTETAPVRSALEDINGDKLLDLILQFNTQDTSIRCGDTSASLTGETLSGQAIEGSDSITTVGCR